MFIWSRLLMEKNTSKYTPVSPCCKAMCLSTLFRSLCKHREASTSCGTRTAHRFVARFLRQDSSQVFLPALHIWGLQVQPRPSTSIVGLDVVRIDSQNHRCVPVCLLEAPEVQVCLYRNARGQSSAMSTNSEWGSRCPVLTKCFVEGALRYHSIDVKIESGGSTQALFRQADH